MRVRRDITNTWEGDRISVSFRCDKDLWISFDSYVTGRYGNYKKSILIESLIRKYMKQKTRGYEEREEPGARGDTIFDPYKEYDQH